MAPSKLLIGGAGAAAVLGMRAARALRPRAAQEAPIAPARAASPAPPPPSAGPRELDRDVSDEDVAALRDDLRRELERLAAGDVKASRSGLGSRPAR